MKLTEADIKKFQDIYREYFGKEISKEKAYEDGIALVRLMQIIYKPVRKADYQKIQDERAKLTL